MRTQVMAAWLGCVVSSVSPAAMSAQGTEDGTMAEAGDVEAGGFWTFIHKLSGPSFEGWSFGLSCTLPCVNPFRQRARALHDEPKFRVGFAVGSSDRADLGDTPGDTSEVNMDMLRLYGDYALKRVQPLSWLTGGVTVGAAAVAHRFKGNDFDSFTHFSFVPAQAQVVVAFCDVLTYRAGLGAQVFLTFDDDDFAGSTVRGIRRDQPELTWYHFYNSIGIRLSSIGRLSC